MPDRSTLFRLPPIATGTALVEGLSGYLNRLATEHSVSVSDLIELDVFPLGRLAIEDQRGRRRQFRASCYLMDGSESHTQPWIDALESATMQGGLHALTLLPYSRLCEGSWIRQKRAWCPHCLEAWGRRRSKIYEPLIWSIKVTYRCPFHRVTLENSCGSCGRSCTPLAGMSQPGYCAYCLSWLGRSKKHHDQMVLDSYGSWCSDQTAVLIAAMSKIPPLLTSDAIARALEKYIGSKVGICTSSIAEYTGCTRRSISTWIEGTTRPRVESFFRLCYALKITPLYLLGYRERNGVGDVYDEWAARQDDVRKSIPSPKMRAGRPSGQPYLPVSRLGSRDSSGLRQLRQALELAMEMTTYVSPRKIAQQLGYSSPDRILRKFPNLCAALNARRKREAGARQSHIRSRLERAVLEWPPPTLKSIARELCKSSSTALRTIEPVLCEQILEKHEEWKREQLKEFRSLIEREIEVVEMVSLRRFCNRAGISLSLVTSEFPGLKRRYVEQYRIYRDAQRSQHDEDFRREVKVAVTNLCERGEYPSVGSVLLLNPSFHRAGWDKVQQAIQAAIEPTNLEVASRRGREILAPMKSKQGSTR